MPFLDSVLKFLNDTLKFFNDNAGGIQAIFGILIFVVTTIYVIINSSMHKEMIKARELSETPEISLRLKKVDGNVHFNFEIENISNVPIYNLVFSNYPDIKIFDSLSTKDIGFFKNGLKYLAPKQLYDTYFLDRDIVDDSVTLEFFMTYENKDGKKFERPISINLSLLEKTLQFGNKH